MMKQEDWMREYKFVVESAGLFKREDRALVKLIGNDRVRWLQGMVTNDVKALQPAQWMPASVLSIKGRVLADLLVIHCGDEIWMEMDADSKESTLATLQKYIIRDDVKLEAVSPTHEIYTLLGPKAGEALQEAFSINVEMFSAGSLYKAQLGATAVHFLSRDDLFNPSFELYFPKEIAAQAEKALLEKTQAVQMISKQTFEIFRIQAGIPQYGVDISEENLVLEIPYLEKGISYTKGCYIGQEPLARLHGRGGNVSKRLMGLVIQNDLQALPRDCVVQISEKEVGKTRSSCYSPKLNATLALAFIHRDAFEPGTELTVLCNQQHFPAKVVALPL